MTPVFTPQTKRIRFKNETLRFPDKFGNELICKHTKKLIGLYVKLRTERRKREIGFINKKERIWTVKRERLSHLFRKLNAYGFNYRVINETTRFDKVLLMDDYGAWLIPRDVIIKFGVTLQFSNDKKHGESYELQLFLPLDVIEQYPVEGSF